MNSYIINTYIYLRQHTIIIHPRITISHWKSPLLRHVRHKRLGRLNPTQATRTWKTTELALTGGCLPNLVREFVLPGAFRGQSQKQVSRLRISKVD